MGVFSKPKARRSADQPGCTQIAQLGPQHFRSAHTSRAFIWLALVSCLGTGLYRRAASGAQGADHLHLAVGVLGLACCATCQDCAGRCLSIYRIGLAGAVLIAPLGADHLAGRYTLGFQQSSESGPEGARPLDPDLLYDAQLSGPSE